MFNKHKTESRRFIFGSMDDLRRKRGHYKQLWILYKKEWYKIIIERIADTYEDEQNEDEEQH